MDLNLEHPVGTAMGSLFQQIIADLKNSTPLWEDLVMKASKLHMCLRSAIQAIATYLDAFQKIADAATNSKGGSKEIGTALTRVCLRHKAVETKMKSFTAAIMDCLIAPLQERIEEWKRQVAVIDKDHTKEHKRCRAELKKRSTDTLRLQKKAKKGQSDTMQSLVNSSLQDMTQRRAELEEIEKKSLRMAMVEERERYCTFVNFLQPVVKEEYEVMYELSHLQEAMDAIVNVTKEPNVLPPSSEEIILATKSSIALYPESPGAASGGNGQGCTASLGSRKSSVCSINSLNSSGSAGSQHQRSLSQLISPAIRLKLAESNDSGFCSSQTSTASQSHIMSTWPPNSQDPAVSAVDRPHTISSTYERGHQRPALTVYTFQSPEVKAEPPKSNSIRPPLPIRCSSLERSSTVKVKAPSSLPAHVTKDYPQMQPTYVNMTELASMAASKLSSTFVQKQTPLISPCESSSSTATPQNASPVSADVTVTPTKVEDDKILGSSVLAKTSMFEKLEQIQASVLKRVDSKLVKKPDREADKLHRDSIEKLNSLIDELDLLQRGCEVPKMAIDHEVERQEEVVCQQEYIQNNCEVVTLRYKEPKVDSPTADVAEVRNRVTSFKQPPPSPTTPDQCDGVFRPSNRPAISPRPASLSASRSRRSSVNSAKPPPPVRRSSSVTPSQQLNKLATQNLSQQNLMNVSSESLPPPPAYLLDSENISQSAGSVAEAIKALTDLKHFPASPEILRRTQQTVNSTSKQRTSPSQLYAQPKVNKVSSFRHQSHSPTPAGDFHSSSSSDGDSGRLHGRHGQSPQQQIYYRLSDHQKATMYGGQEGYHHHSVNAKRLSGKAFAVRNLIHSQTLPDPRIAHATLMDQIKRGANLKPNKTCNDRSAPKIH